MYLISMRLCQVVLFFGCCFLSQAAATPPLSTVTESASACPAGPIANTACREFEVSCPDVKPIHVRVRITEPSAGVPGVPFRGTVVIGSGGTGSGFYVGQDGGLIFSREIAAMGFRVVDRDRVGGWPTAEGGLQVGS